ncbi:MAG TPA: NAD(P)-dependent oxidoreductase [Thermaerobacter sp.]
MALAVEAVVVVGDDRQAACAETLQRRGWRVRCLGRPVAGLPASSDPDIVTDADVVVGPVTGFEVGGLGGDLAGPAAEPEHWPFRPGALYIGGRPGEALRRALATRGARWHDLLQDEAFAEANALPTAEGAVLRAQLLGRRIIAGQAATVLGFGRCGRALALLLRGMGAAVTVVARRPGQRREAAAQGLEAVPFDDLAGVLERSTLVFNTVPAPVLGREALARLPRGALVIDIASRPGGVDWDAARELGVEAYLELALPARFFPVTAGEILAETVVRVVAGE